MTSRYVRKLLQLSPMLGGIAIAVAACNEFDPELYKNAENVGSSGAAGSGTGGVSGTAGAESGGTAGESSGGTSGSSGGGTGGGASGAANWEKTADWCPLPSAAVLNSDLRKYEGSVALNTLVSDVQEVPKATGLVGPDGVIGFTLAAGERVSVVYDFVKGPGELGADVDLAMYLMGACDVANFIRRNDRCPMREAEDVWWQMNDAAGTYYLGFDSKDYDQTLIDPKVKLTVSFPRYGDTIVDQGEACDDGNKNDGDGCTHDGLWELKYASMPVQEKEPNNHPWGSNVVIMSAGQTMYVSGTTSQTCDNDFFAIDVQEGWFPRVTMLNQNGADCDVSVGAITMQLNRLDGKAGVEQTKLGDGKAVLPNNCPSFTETTLNFPTGLAAGRYVVELKGFEVGKGVIPYRLKIELVNLAAGGGV